MSLECKDVRVVRRGAIQLDHEVTVLPKKEGDMEELRLALAVVDRYKKAALQAIRTREKDADYTMVEYAVKNDCVIVKVRQGAAG